MNALGGMPNMRWNAWQNQLTRSCHVEIRGIGSYKVVERCAFDTPKDRDVDSGKLSSGHI